MAAGARSTRRQTHLVLDRWRASRALEARRQAGAPASSLEILAPLLDAPRVRVSLVSAPRPWAAAAAAAAAVKPGEVSSGASAVVALLQEVVGVQHIKGAVFDDDVLLTGANVSADYFSARQDRCILLRGCAPLADLFSELLVALAAAAGTDVTSPRSSSQSPPPPPLSPSPLSPLSPSPLPPLSPSPPPPPAAAAAATEHSREGRAAEGLVAAVCRIFARARERAGPPPEGPASAGGVWVLPAAQIGACVSATRGRGCGARARQRTG